MGEQTSAGVESICSKGEDVGGEAGREEIAFICWHIGSRARGSHSYVADSKIGYAIVIREFLTECSFVRPSVGQPTLLQGGAPLVWHLSARNIERRLHWKYEGKRR